MSCGAVETALCDHAAARSAACWRVGRCRPPRSSPAERVGPGSRSGSGFGPVVKVGVRVGVRARVGAGGLIARLFTR